MYLLLEKNRPVAVIEKKQSESELKNSIRLSIREYFNCKKTDKITFDVVFPKWLETRQFECVFESKDTNKRRYKDIEIYRIPSY